MKVPLIKCSECPILKNLEQDILWWVSHVLENRCNYYQIQHSIASARFYPDRTEFWDENFSERAVSSEHWSVERLENGNWRGMNFTPATISYNVINEEEVQLVRTVSSPRGTLRTTYIFRGARQ